MSQGLYPILPLPGQSFDPSYIARLVRQIEAYLIRSDERKVILASTISATNLPTGGNGLRAGDLFLEPDGVVKVCFANHGYPNGMSSTTAVGTVTVSLP